MYVIEYAILKEDPSCPCQKIYSWTLLQECVSMDEATDALKNVHYPKMAQIIFGRPLQFLTPSEAGGFLNRRFRINKKEDN